MFKFLKRRRALAMLAGTAIALTTGAVQAAPYAPEAHRVLTPALEAPLLLASRGRGADDGARHHSRDDKGGRRGGRGRGADDAPGDDHGGRRGGKGRGADDAPGDDHGGRGRGRDDGPHHR